MQTKPIRTLIADDEPIGIIVIRELINHLTTDVEIIGTARDGMEAVQLATDLRPDLLFLDIDMPYMNGIEVLHRLRLPSFHTIFTTGFGTPEMQKFKGENIDYLLKPIDPQEFTAAIEKVRRKIGKTNQPH